jgi:hypothetical protein
MSDSPVQVSLDLPGSGAATVRRLDEESFMLAATEPESFRASARPLDRTGAVIAIDLPPFGLATVDRDLEQA